MNDTWLTSNICNIKNITDAICGITVDNKGNIYFTNKNWNIYKVRQDDNSETEPQSIYFKEALCLCGIIWTEGNNLYVCDSEKCKIYLYEIDTGKISTLAGNGVQRHKDGNIKDAQFCYPQGIAVDKNGNLYIAERTCVRKINLVEQTVTTVAGIAGGYPREGYKNGPSTQAMFGHPVGVAITDDDTIYVVDRGNQCIRKIKDGIVSKVVGTLDIGYRDGYMGSAELCGPRAITIYNSDVIMVVDGNGLRIVDLIEENVSTEFQDFNISSVTKLNSCVLFAGTRNSIMKLVKSTWKWKRWIWIGHLKENSNDCLLATLPRDIIKEIALYLI